MRRLRRAGGSADSEGRGRAAAASGTPAEAGAAGGGGGGSGSGSGGGSGSDAFEDVLDTDNVRRSILCRLSQQFAAPAMVRNQRPTGATTRR